MNPGETIVYLSPITRDQARANMEKLGDCDVKVLDEEKMNEEIRNFESLFEK